MVNMQLKPFSKSTFEQLRQKHESLAESVPARDGISQWDSANSSYVAEIEEFMQEVQELVANARAQNEVGAIEWASKIANHWQVVLTKVFGKPVDVRGRLGIKPGDVFSDTSTWSEEDLHRFLETQANEIGSKRKILHLLKQLEFYSLHPERIHAEIPSTEQECKQDWKQACTFLAMDILLGRVHLDRLAMGSELLESLDSVFLEDVVRLNAYLAWEQSHVGWAPERSLGFFQNAEIKIQQKTCTRHSCSPRVRDKISGWYRERTQISPSSESHSLARIEAKAQRVWEASGQPALQNWLVAEQQANLFEWNIVIAIDEGCGESASAVAESVLGKKNPQYRLCATALEAIVLSHFVDFS